MGKIYVCESGCKYEGGSAFGASTSLARAWLKIRERRIEAEGHHYGFGREVVRLVGKWHWVTNFDYFLIREYDDA